MTAHPTKDTRTELILRLLSFWRILFGVLALAGAAAPWAGLQTLGSNWQRILLFVTLLLFAVLSVAGAFHIRRRDHSGRIISLALDYLAFVACTVITLNTGEFFIGIDALGTNFGRSIPYLGIVLAGYLLSTLDDYFPQRKQTSGGGVTDPDPDYPYSGAIIGQYGLDIPKGVLWSSTTTYDLMSYCDPQWVSDYTYQGLYTDQRANGAAALAAPAPGLFIRATFDEAGEVTLKPVYALSLPATASPAESDYQVELVDGKGQVLAGYPAPVLEATADLGGEVVRGIHADLGGTEILGALQSLLGRDRGVRSTPSSSPTARSRTRSRFG